MDNQTRPYFTYTPDGLRAQKWFRPELYPFTPHFAETSFGKMHYVDEGTGPVVVLLHGTPSWSFEYAGVIPKLVAAGFRVIAPDLLGFGLSERPGGKAVEKQLSTPGRWDAARKDSFYSPAFHRAALVEWFSQLQLQAAHLVVHDMSGPVVWPLVASEIDATKRTDASDTAGTTGTTGTPPAGFPPILSVSLINTWAWSFFGSVPKFEKTAKMLSGGLTRWLYLRAGFSAKVLLPKAWGVPVDKNTARHLTKMMPDRRSRPATYGVVRSLIQPDGAPEVNEVFKGGGSLPPAQLIWGMKDALLPEEFISIWQNYPKLESVHRINDTGHFPQITHFGRVARTIADFAKTHSRYAPEVTGKGS